MNGPITRSLQRSVAVLVFAVWSTLGMASADVQVRTKSVSYRDLNLANPQGAAALYRRITRAAEEVCGPAEQTGSLLPRPGFRECVRRAIAEAVAKVDRPELSAYHAQREHRVPPATMAAAKR
jgi:UrcA family protein